MQMHYACRSVKIRAWTDKHCNPFGPLIVLPPLSLAQKVSGNAAKSGISTGDTVVYASSFFGDELWPSDDVNFTKSAINAAPSPVCLVYVSLRSCCQLLASRGPWKAQVPIADAIQGQTRRRTPHRV